MTIIEAQREFRIRRYLWAKIRAAEELRNGFPHFWLFNGSSRKYYMFISNLQKREQEIFVGALLKRFHRDASSALGETTSTEENALEDRFFKFNLQLTDIERDIAIRRERGETVRFASKGKVQKAMIASFIRAFARDGLEVTEMRGYTMPFLRMRFCGWLVTTNFFFGRSRSLISYDHLIASEDRISHPTTPGVTAPALVLDLALCWIGLGHMVWDYLMDADIEPACDSVITMCRECFDELPKLLKDIEREKIAPT